MIALVGTVSFVGCASTTTSPGTGSQPQLSANPPSANFGNVVVGTSNTQTITLSNSGAINLTISQATVSGNGFSVTGLTFPLTLSAGQRTSFNVAFAPASAGSVTGTLSLVSDARNSPTTIALSGSGIQSIPHSSTLSWNPSPSTVVGYNVYRGTQSGGPYAKLNASPVLATTYTDNSVLAGQTYFYVVTAVDSSNVESVHSNEVSATMPSQ